MPRRAPVVTHRDRLGLAQRFEEGDHVPDGVQDGVGVLALGAVGPAIPPLIRRDRTVAGGGKSAKWWRHVPENSGNPWSSTTSGPVPWSRKCILMPSTLTEFQIEQTMPPADALWVRPAGRPGRP